MKKEYNWTLHTDAWNWILMQIDSFSKSNPSISTFEAVLNSRTGTRLIDFTDHLVMEETQELIEMLKRFGYSYQKDGKAWVHSGAFLPAIITVPSPGEIIGLAIKVDDVGEFLETWNLDLPIEGSMCSRLRRCKISTTGNVAFWVIERRSTQFFEPVVEDRGFLEMYFNFLQYWENRPRFQEDKRKQLEELFDIVGDPIRFLGTDITTYLFFEAERRYWLSRNTFAQHYKSLADSIGVGLANHDHHTFRSSRQYFHYLIGFFDILGFKCRERFYYPEAGWGSQVMENPNTGITLFLDVDLKPEELEIDFIDTPLDEMESFGIIDLWCGLHGDSLTGPGLHHLALRTGVEPFNARLAKHNIPVMIPFNRLPFLWQAFSHGERWKITKEQVRELLKRNLITGEKANMFIQNGVAGSHIEMLQRQDGYKGFKQEEILPIS